MLKIEMSSLKAPSHDEVCKENKDVSARFEPFEALRFTAYQSFANISVQMVKTHIFMTMQNESLPVSTNSFNEEGASLEVPRLSILPVSTT